MKLHGWTLVLIGLCNIRCCLKTPTGSTDGGGRSTGCGSAAGDQFTLSG